MIAALGGPADFLSSWQNSLPEAPVIQEVKAPRSGYLGAMDGEALGFAVVELGGGRKVEADRIDPAVGLSGVLRLGTSVSAGDTLARVHAARPEQADAAAEAVLAAMQLSDTPPDLPELVRERID
jgi:thymidine phosphorylase